MKFSTSAFYLALLSAATLASPFELRSRRLDLDEESECGLCKWYSE